MFCNEINKRVGWIFVLCRVEFFKIGKRDVTFIREMRVPIRRCLRLLTYFFWTTGGLPLTRKSLTRFLLTRFLAYVRVSGGISVSRGPQYSPTNTSFM